MINAIKMWGSFIKNAILQRMAYRTEFAISLITMSLIELVGPIITALIYYSTEGIAGWSFNQIFLLQSILILIKGISFPFFYGIVWNSNITLQKGEFDLILIKPRNTLFTFICSSFDSEDVAKLFTGIILVTIAIYRLGTFPIFNILLMLLSIVVGVGFMFASALFFSAFIFKFIQTWRLYELIDIIFLYGSYPKKIYGSIVGNFFTFGIPIFIAGYYPVEILYGNYSWSILYGVISVIFLVALGIFTWFRVIKNYASAGG